MISLDNSLDGNHANTAGALLLGIVANVVNRASNYHIYLMGSQEPQVMCSHESRLGGIVHYIYRYYMEIIDNLCYREPWVSFLQVSCVGGGLCYRELWIHRIKGTASIKMREIDPSHVKEISFTCSLVIN